MPSTFATMPPRLVRIRGVVDHNGRRDVGALRREAAK
jgi:hypothetical protein